MKKILAIRTASNVQFIIGQNVALHEGSAITHIVKEIRICNRNKHAIVILERVDDPNNLRTRQWDIDDVVAILT